MSVWSVEAISELIRLFRENTCLWKIKSVDYASKSKRNEAYDVLVKFCKTIGFPSADREFVTKKLQNLRCAFRKELRKVLRARENGENHQPSLWYYDQLMFLEDQEAANDVNQSLKSYDTDDSNDDLRTESHSQSRQSQVTSTFQKPTIHLKRSPSNSDLHEAQQARISKRFKPNLDTQTLQRKLLHACTEVLKKKEMTEFEALSVSIKKKLEKMDCVQAIYAETIIHTVLRRGLLYQLSETTDLCDRQCSKLSKLKPSSSFVAKHERLGDDDDPLSE